jgi:NAD(P)-dependent dehydrogenase (short-subunit alcohol dehydrogenase family)
VIACRNLDEGEKAKEKILKISGNSQVRVLQLDLGSFSSIRTFCRQFTEHYQRLDVLVNNAGVFTMDSVETENNLELTMGVNYFGTFLLTNLLVPSLEKSSDGRIINVISDAYKMGKLDIDNIEKRRTKGIKAYAASKLALAIFTSYLADKLESKNIVVNAVHPGHVKSDMWNFNKWYAPIIRFFGKATMVDVAEGAKPIVYLAASEKVKNTSGKYFNKEKEEEIEKKGFDEQNKLWKKSEIIVGLD